jgi:hypothetical protein
LKFTGSFLLLCGWLIVLAALLLLQQPGERMGFVTAGIAIEVMGLILLSQGYGTAQRNAMREGAPPEDQV